MRCRYVSASPPLSCDTLFYPQNLADLGKTEFFNSHACFQQLARSFNVDIAALFRIGIFEKATKHHCAV